MILFLKFYILKRNTSNYEGNFQLQKKKKSYKNWYIDIKIKKKLKTDFHFHACSQILRIFSIDSSIIYNRFFHLLRFHQELRNILKLVVGTDTKLFIVKQELLNFNKY